MDWHGMSEFLFGLAAVLAAVTKLLERVERIGNT
jgi:hypothetical protein